MSIKKAPLRAILFDRVSTTEQGREGRSLEYQTAEGHKYADRVGLKIVKVYTVTETGRYSEKRKEFNAMLDYIEQNDIQNIIFKSVDRMSRNFKDLERIKSLIESGVVIHFYGMGQIYNRDSMHYTDVMNLSFMIAVAQGTSDKISHDIKQVNKHKVNKGLPVGPSPLGYRIKEGQFRKDPEWKDKIDWLFDTYDHTDITVPELAAQARAKGFKSSQGKEFGKSYLHSMLCKPVYAGYFYYKGVRYDGSYEPYISEERFKKRREKLGVRMKSIKTFLLSGLLRHEETKLVLTGEEQKENIYYFNRIPGVRYREDRIFELIDTEICRLEILEGWKDRIFEAIDRETVTREEGDKDRKKQISLNLQDMEKKLDRLYDMQADEDMNSSVLTKKIRDLKTEISGYRTEVTRDLSAVQNMALVVKDAVQQLSEFASTWTMASVEDKAELLKMMVKYVKIWENRAEIVWRDPFGQLFRSGSFDNLVRRSEECTPGRIGFELLKIFLDGSAV